MLVNLLTHFLHAPNALYMPVEYCVSRFGPGGPDHALYICKALGR